MGTSTGLRFHSLQGAKIYGAKNPEISNTKCVELAPKALIEPLVVGTIARFDVTAPSLALSVDTKGCVAPCGHKVRKPSDPDGITVPFSTKALAVAEAPQGIGPVLFTTFTSIFPLKGGVPGGLRVSSTRQGFNENSDKPPAAGGAKYPLMSMTRSELLVTNTEISPFVPDGTIAAFAVTTPVGELRVETRGCGCPAGHVVRKPSDPLGTEVKFSEYACAAAETLQVLERMGKVRVALPTIEGPPSGPAAFRVSTRRQGVKGKKARAEGLTVGETKYPLMSRTMSVSLEAKAQTPPLMPVGKMAAPAFTRPSTELRVELNGRGAPHGNIVKNPSEP